MRRLTGFARALVVFVAVALLAGACAGSRKPVNPDAAQAKT